MNLKILIINMKSYIDFFDMYLIVDNSKNSILKKFLSFII